MTTTTTVATGLMVAATVLTAWTADGAKMLAVFPYNAHSHFVMVEPLMAALSDRGHEITVISPFPRPNSVHRYANVDVSDALPPIISRLNVTEDTGPVDPITGLRNLCRMNHRVCEATFEHPQVRELIRRTGRNSFDVVFTEAFATDCFAVFAHYYDAPLVSVRTSDYSPQLNRRVANPQHPAYLVNHLLTYAGHSMSFGQRLVNTLATHFGAVGYHAFSDGPSTELARRHFGADTPPVPDIVRRRTALVLVNGHQTSFTQPRPLGPNVIEVGGIHIKQPVDDSTNEWTDYCDSCGQGVVYVSFGSLLNGSSFPDNFVTSCIRAFEMLPYCVLWKYEGEMKSKRVKASKWMPQQQILSHRNVKAFVTHGGLMSVMEAVYFGVPMVGIPVFGDQQSNVANCIDKGVAIGLDHRLMTEQKLIRSVQTIVTNGEYRLKASELSAKFRDTPMSALETAVFWTEYVIRYGNETHMTSPAVDLNFYQCFSLDIIGFILSTCLFLVYLAFQIKKCTR